MNRQKQLCVLICPHQPPLTHAVPPPFPIYHGWIDARENADALLSRSPPFLLLCQFFRWHTVEAWPLYFYFYFKLAAVWETYTAAGLWRNRTVLKKRGWGRTDPVAAFNGGITKQVLQGPTNHRSHSLPFLKLVF